MKILMVGATGAYAHYVLPELKKRGATVRALASSDESGEKARNEGADEVAIGDLDDEQSLMKAAEGVEGVFFLNPAFALNEAQRGVAMVNAAKAAGVRKIVFSGVIHPSISKMRNHAGKRPVEEALYESGMNFTVLQPTMFMQTIANGWKEVAAKGTFSLPYSKTKRACYVDYRDVAEAAAIGLTTERLDYGTFELSSPGMFDRVELAAMMAKALGKPVEAREITFDEWVAQAKVPEGPFRDGMRLMYADYDQFGFPGGNALVLRAILEKEPRGLEAFFREQASGEK